MSTCSFEIWWIPIIVHVEGWRREIEVVMRRMEKKGREVVRQWMERNRGG
jgi:hypothetical protein